jgi:hypothetical protein
VGVTSCVTGNVNELSDIGGRFEAQLAPLQVSQIRGKSALFLKRAILSFGDTLYVAGNQKITHKI